MNKILSYKNLLCIVLIGVSISTTAFRSHSDASPVQRAIVDGNIEAVETQPIDEPTLEALDGITTESGLKFITVEDGNGPKPLPGQFVKVAYTGRLADGSIFNSATTAAPYVFKMDQGAVISGWEEGISMLNEGGRAMLLVPPELAHGDTGATGIDPGATLVFDIELLKVFEGAPAEPMQVDEDAFTETDSGLKFHDIEEGDGDSPSENYIVTVHYTGWLEDGTKFSSSVDWDTPYMFALDQEQVIPGWEEGIRSMQVGGKRQLVIPSDLAYEDEGIDDLIPGGSTLIFDVELLEILRPSPESPLSIDEADFAETDSGLQFFDIEQGDGAYPEEGSTVSVHYTGWLADGTKFGSSLDTGFPYMFIIGQEQVIPGWEEGIQSMQVGSQRQLIIPASLAYGAEGVDGVIPPDETLTFEIELAQVR